MTLKKAKYRTQKVIVIEKNRVDFPTKSVSENSNYKDDQSKKRFESEVFRAKEIQEWGFKAKESLGCKKLCVTEMDQ